jgi:DNA polymerase-3 subunit alpha
MTTKRPSRTGLSRYARCKVEDLHQSVECVMWTDEYARFKDEFQEDRPCFIWGTIERNREEPGLVLTRVLNLEAGKRELARGLSIRVILGEHTAAVIEHIASILQKARGSCPVELVISDPAGRQARLRLGEGFRINPATLDLRELEAHVGTGRARFVGPSYGRNGR